MRVPANDFGHGISGSKTWVSAGKMVPKKKECPMTIFVFMFQGQNSWSEEKMIKREKAKMKLFGPEFTF